MGPGLGKRRKLLGTSGDTATVEQFNVKNVCYLHKSKVKRTGGHLRGTHIPGT